MWVKWWDLMWTANTPQVVSLSSNVSGCYGNSITLSLSAKKLNNTAGTLITRTFFGTGPGEGRSSLRKGQRFQRDTCCSNFSQFTHSAAAWQRTFIFCVMVPPIYCSGVVFDGAQHMFSWPVLSKTLKERSEWGSEWGSDGVSEWERCTEDSWPAGPVTW